ncbi:ankyrin repeat domain-containing protein [Wolbachia endosymbiont of Oedothorax gibbosus]|uniref:ankyrin repeat domain-containing protein n=1 Tax=Wolbachia endosymbiont of Oedothorax gibbosus TaxID=931100 RepID=UPI0020251C8C|nr:ankyrin repeat domain-containing protein [Wolbachia endosymbiont of Oedothorax gibbosus]
MNEVQSRLNGQLFDALRAGNANQIEELIRGGANVNAYGRMGQDTTLTVAIERGNIDIVKFLISKGADVNMKNRGWAPLRKAISYDDAELVRILIEAGADVNEKVDSRHTVLNFAIGYSEITSTECSKILTKHIILRDPKVIKPDYISNHAELSEFWDNFQSQVLNEIKKMKEEKIGNSNISFYQFLFENDINKLAGYLSNKDTNLQEKLKETKNIEKYKTDYPLYANMIESMIATQCQRGIKKANLLDASDIVMKHSNLEKLPKEMRDRVASYLTDPDRRALIKSLKIGG